MLAENWRQWTRDCRDEPANDHRKTRYRHPDIKQALLAETANKCVYCESKIGDTCPGDTEHMIPTSERPAGRFFWRNLTIACTECNRRKLNYYEKELMFLNPYVDDVESCVIHQGPLVSWSPGNERAEATIKRLQLHDKSRMELIARKIEHLEHVNDTLHRRDSSEGVIHELAKAKIEEMCRWDEKFSGMVSSVVGAPAAS